jgi:phosphate transport system permease protein
MERVTLVVALFISAMLGINGSLSTPPVFARQGRNPRIGAVAGGAAGFAGSFLIAGILLAADINQVAVIAIASFAGGIGALIVLWNVLPAPDPLGNNLPDGVSLERNIGARHIRGSITRVLYLVAIIVALVALATLIWTIVNKTVGLTAVQYAVQPEELTLNGEPAGRSLEDLDKQELGAVLAENARVARLRVFILEHVVQADQVEWAELSPQPVSSVLKGHEYAPELADVPFNKLDESQTASILTLDLDRDELEAIVFDEIISPEVVESWTLWKSLTERSEIEDSVEKEFPQAKLEWRSWLNWEFISSPLDPRKPDATGLRPALYGSIMIIIITITVAFPVGVGAAIYLEEYAGDSFINRVIQTNINNLAGVPSIIYGMLGLAIFVRTTEAFTSGRIFGADTANGRTIVSAGFTLALLILPIIIINAQEAIRAVPNSLRQASYGLGATQWQTIWNHVLPYAMPGILTGTILAISRAIGETAPLILVGAATYITQEPKGPFSNFTALPMVIYRWTTLQQAEFRNAAAAAIVVLLIMLLTLNSVAVILRNRFSRRLS